MFAKRQFNISHTDITGDGISENLLALVDIRWVKECTISPYCASSENDRWNGKIRLRGGMTYELLPLDEAATAINWQHKCIKKNTYAHSLTPHLGSGELIYYKKRPYWLSPLSWNQEINDNYQNYKNNPNDPYASIFELAPLTYDRLEDKLPGLKPPPASFENIVAISKDHFATCYFGYFHKNNIKQNPPKERR